MNAASAEMLGVMVSGSTIPGMSSASVSEEGSKKIRKPYTITKSRESWTEQEHDKFLEALQLFDRDWKKLEAFVGSKSVIQIRSHAQKYFLKVQKNGTGEHVPPPRPKRKSAQPYPQKASKCGINPDLGDVGLTSVRASSNSLSGSSPCGWPNHALSGSQVGPESCIRAAPDFAEVYKFIGSVFDPGVTDHLRKLRDMTAIDREAVLLLMRNLSINLSSPDFDDYRLLLSVYDERGLKGKCSWTEDLASTPGAVPRSLSPDAGDDTTSASGQGAATAPSTPLLVSPRSGDSDPTQPRASELLAYSDASADAGPLRGPSHDVGVEGGVALSASFPGLVVSPPSPGVPESGSSAVASAGAPVLSPASRVPLVKSEGLYSVPSLTSLPSLPVGLVGEEGGVDTWWT